MLSGSGDGLGGGLSCPVKDRCTNYYCTGGLSMCFQGVDKWFPHCQFSCFQQCEVPRFTPVQEGHLLRLGKFIMSSIIIQIFIEIRMKLIYNIGTLSRALALVKSKLYR
jgi:hypothetical protein